ncbi:MULTISPECIES: DegV family protein [Caldisericum]|jgi:DegV family protein with EDD domain|uniref:DegV family protein n=1 Tax=Caldisericum exile TaxID=693075 RepID=A0A2J6WFS0_9BACT|nr:MAG: DegV family protein [Caldisericum exile]PMP84269.1 MAG: DegV family protein [Caldisericum exile]
MIKIVVDSTAYLGKEFVELNDIKVVPIRIFYKGRDFKEGEEISIEEFYQFLKNADEFPKTSQPSPDDFISVFKPILEKGDSAISILISEKVSGTINSARLAIETLKTNTIKIIDSRSSIYAIRYLTEHALNLIKNGLDFDTVYNETSKVVERLRDRFALSEIRYLGASGRIKKEIALIGSVLSVKPVFSFTNGLIKLEGIFRSFNKAKEYLKKFITNEFREFGLEKIAIMYGLNKDEANEFGEYIKEIYGLKPDIIQVGCAIGNYAGPEWLGIGILRGKA